MSETDRARSMFPHHRRALLILLAASVAGCAAVQPESAESESAVVFVCEHGNAKSLMAAELFNREALRHRSPLRAVARGLRPEPGVPAAVASGLHRDGFESRGFEARSLSDREAIAARRVVAINLERDDVATLKGSVDSWPDIPAASIDYPAARNALERRVVVLLDELLRPAGPR